MKNRKINKTFYSYILPSILAFALSGIYTIVDGFFIGNKLGDDAWLERRNSKNLE